MPDDSAADRPDGAGVRHDAADRPDGADRPDPAEAPNAAGLEADWGRRVRANRDQVNRFREVPDGRDFYRPTSSLFTADPLRTDDPILAALLALARPSDTWLDIGAGAGRFALPIAGVAREVIAIDPSAGMLAGLRAGIAEHGIANVRVIEGRWPADADGLRADVALIAHVGYDVEAIGPFLSAMERAADRLCVAVLMEQAPAAIANPFWPAIHGEARVPLPALPELLALLRARGAVPTVERVEGAARRWATTDEALAFLRQQLWVVPDGGKDRRLTATVEALPRDPDGAIRIASPHRDIGVVSWRPV